MAYRRRQQIGRVDATFTYNYGSVSPREVAAASPDTYSSSFSALSLAAKAIRASSVNRDSSISSLYEQSALSSPRGSTPSSAKDSSMDEHLPKQKDHESKHGFWGVLARKAKAILDDDNHNTGKLHQTPGGPTLQRVDRSKKGQHDTTYETPESWRKRDSPALQKGFDAITSSLNYIGNALEEGMTAVENRTSDIIQETRKIQIRKKTGISRPQNQASNLSDSRQPQMPIHGQPHMSLHGQPKIHADFDTQLKASRDVAMAMAAKAKLLLRELKTVKADLAFAKERCGQLEEENRILRESREKGGIPEDDDLMRLQLESLLGEKARLAQENSVYARENRFLREIVEYHHLTMQDVVYLDEGSEEVTEVYPSRITAPAEMQPSVAMPAVSPTPTIPQGAISPTPQNLSLDSLPYLEVSEASQTVNAVNPYVQSSADHIRKH